MSIGEIIMDSWVIGDLHGCFNSFLKLIDKINPTDETQIFLVGDLINRGPQSEETLDFLMNTSLKVYPILGNHDIAFISFFHKIFTRNNELDCYYELSKNPKAITWIHWLRKLPLYLRHEKNIIVHAGLYPYWSIEQNLAYADSIGDLLKGDDYVKSLTQLWHNASAHKPEQYQLSFALNVFTRMRYINEDRSLCLKTKGLKSLDCTENKSPWFDLWPNKIDQKIYFGHWSALRGETRRNDILCLDTGCVWKETLTAMNMQTHKKITQEFIEL